MKLALTPLNVTAVAPVKSAPLIVTVVPTGPMVGAKIVIVGGFTTVNAPLLVAVSEVTAKLAPRPLNATAVALVKLVPLMVTLVPTGPLVGAKIVIVGGLSTVNELVLVAVPPGVVTLSD